MVVNGKRKPEPETFIVHEIILQRWLNDLYKFKLSFAPNRGSVSDIKPVLL
jgi:hypothetical protein